MMSFLKKPAVAFLLAFLIVLGSTFFTVKAKLQRNYDLLCENVCARISDFAVKNDLAELDASARYVAANASTHDLKDYHGLIIEYTDYASGYSSSETRAADQAVKSFNRFLQEAEQFPAYLFARMLRNY